jgi:SAM-dependent methyltransferase
MDFNHHYDKIAEKYDELRPADWDEGMLPWLMDHVKAKLALNPDDVLVDVGGGTGSALAFLRQLVAPKLDWVNMDPSPKMCEVATKKAGLIVLEGRADNAVSVLEKACLQHQPNKIMSKHSAHHFKDVFAKFATDIFSYLPSGGEILLLVTDRKCSLPLFPEAASRFANSNPDPQLYVDCFNQAGFATTIDKPNYVTKVSKNFWYGFIRNRMFSTLRDFTDEELEEGIKELESLYPLQDDLPLIDHEVFIVAKKP